MSPLGFCFATRLVIQNWRKSIQILATTRVRRQSSLVDQAKHRFAIDVHLRRNCHCVVTRFIYLLRAEYFEAFVEPILGMFRTSSCARCFRFPKRNFSLQVVSLPHRLFQSHQDVHKAAPAYEHHSPRYC